jgi:hypothetical protein
VTKAVIKQSIKTTGTWANSKGGWFLSVVPQFHQPTGKMVTVDGPVGSIEVPEMAPVPGVWARLRWNDMALTDRLNTFIAAIKANGITVYQRVNIGTQEAPEVIWTADGVTPAPAYLDDIGVIL